MGTRAPHDRPATRVIQNGRMTRTSDAAAAVAERYARFARDEAPGRSELYADWASGVGLEPAVAAILARIPAGRWAEPADVAGAAVFLASPAADYVHGHVLAVDGGWLAR